MSRQKKVVEKEIRGTACSQDAKYIIDELKRYIDQKMDPINLSCKYALTPEEAARYTHIGENRIREIIKANPYAEWLIHVGNKSLIIRSMFEEYLKGGKYF